MSGIYCPIFRGSGAIVVHDILSRNIMNYQVESFSPRWQYFPYAVRFIAEKGSQADILHTTPDYAPFFHKGDMKLFVTFHNYYLDEDYKKYTSLAQRVHYATDLKWNIRKALKLADVVSCVSQATAALVRDDLGYRGEIQVITNGIDPDIYYPLKRIKRSKEFKVLFSGNPNIRKGGHLLRGIADKLRDGIFIYYTSGLNSAANLDDHPRLRKLGHVQHSDMADVYRQMDALILPSFREGMSLSILEAMSSGLPVITSNCSSMPEQIVDCKGGYLCEPGNIEEFSQKINSLSESAELCQRMGEFNRQRIMDSFTLYDMIHRYKNIFEGQLR